MASEREVRVYVFADLRLDAGRRTLTRAGEEIELTGKSFDLLEALVLAAPDVLSTDQLMDRVWAGSVVSQGTLAKRLALLREALGDDSSEPRYVALVRGHGYRLVPEVHDAGGVRRLHGPARWAGIAAAFLVLATVAAWFWPRGTMPPEKSIAVLPFRTLSPDTDDALFADGLTEELRHVLSQSGTLKVAGRISTEYVAARDLDVREIGETLGVAHVLQGTVRRSGEDLRVTVELTSTADRFSLWSNSYDRRMADIIDIQKDIARNVNRQLQALGESASNAFEALDAISPEAYALYLRDG